MEPIIELCIKPGRSCSGCLFRGSAVCKFTALSQVIEFIDRIYSFGRRRASPLAEETWFSGRASASNSVLCAYIPSWGLISMRANWQLIPTMDVVVPPTRTMEDMLEVLDVIVANDEQNRGGFWRMQPWLDLPAVSCVRPDSYLELGVGKSDEILARVVTEPMRRDRR